MSDEKPSQTDQSSQSAANPSTQQPTVAPPTPQINNPPPQINNPPLPKEDPFALDSRLICEIQEGRRSPEQTAIQKPEIVRKELSEKEQS